MVGNTEVKKIWIQTSPTIQFSPLKIDEWELLLVDYIAAEEF